MNDKITIDRSLLQQALDAIEFADQKTKDLHIEFEGEELHYPIFSDAAVDLRAALEATQPAAQPADPYGWSVTGCSTIRRGEFAEIDAKGEARHIGGTARAIALYAAPQPAAQTAERNFCPRCGKRAYDGIHTCTPPHEPAAQPLTNEQIGSIVRKASYGSALRRDGSTSHRIARAIEAAHGIKKPVAA
jgi:hypothetical protein